VQATDAEGRTVFVRLDPSGQVVDEATVLARREALVQEHFDLYGLLDEDARLTIEGDPERFASSVTLVLSPAGFSIARPEPTEPGSIDYAKEETAWAEYYASLRDSRVNALEELVAKLPAEALVTAIDDSMIEVVVPTWLVPVVTRLPHLQGATLRPQDMRHSEQLTALANEAVSFNSFTDASPIRFDGNGNGARINIGHYEQAGNPKLSPHHAAWQFNAGSGSCIVAADCGDYGSWGCSCIGNTCYGNHATWMFSTLGTWDDAYSPAKRIGAPAATIWFAAHYATGNPPVGGTNFTTLRTWWSQNDVHVVAVPLGYYGTLIGKDAAVREDRIALLHSAANAAPAGKACDLSSPNEICVGNFDHGTGTMAGNSSFVNPDTTDREVPDIAAPGVNLSVFDPSGSWVSRSGTSLSAPVATSLVGLLFDAAKTASGPNYYPTLPNYPELVKALLMASATLDADGLGNTSNPGTAPDNKDGAGGIQGDRLYSMWAAGRWSVRLATSNDPMAFTWKTVNLSVGQTLRAYIAWSRCPSSVFGDMSADFGVYICPPSGPCTSPDMDSYDQASEGVEFTAATAGNHTIKLARWYMDACNGTTGEYVGLGYLVR